MAGTPTVIDVARRAGVSRQTVSNVLNAPDRVRPETRVLVEAAIAALGYRPHLGARRLRTGRSATIAIRLEPQPAGISGSVADRFLHALGAGAERRGLSIRLVPAADPAAESRRYLDLRDAGEIDGVVLTGTRRGDDRAARLAAAGIPVVSFGRPWDGDAAESPSPWVDVDGRAGTAAATRHLRERGARAIGFLGWPAGSGTGDDRRAGWRDEAGSAAGPALASPESVPDAHAAVAAALDAATAVDALVCASDTLALGAMMAARERGADLPVVGFDDTPVAEAVGLSSVDQRLDAVAAAVLELLCGAEGGRVLDAPPPGVERHRLVLPALVARDPGPLAPRG